jgi:hypothetical protein
MEIVKRVLGCVIVNGFLNSLLWTIAVYIYISVYPPSGFYGDGRGFTIYITATMGAVIGCIIGCLIGLLNTTLVTSALIGGILYILVGLVLMGKIPSKNEVLSSLLFILVPSILSALASGITARIFNNSPN